MQRIAELFSESTPARGAYRASRTLFDDVQVRWLVGGTARTPRTSAVPGSDESLLSLLQQVSLLETTGYMRNTLLRDSDVFSMAHGLELRVPFVDHEVARVARRFPDSEKLQQGVSKPILVRTMQDILPASSLGRPKQGFTLPFERWMRNELFGEIDTVLTSSTMEAVGLNDVGAALVWSAFQARRPGINWSRPWALFTLKRWADQNDVSFVPPTPTQRSQPAGLIATL